MSMITTFFRKLYYFISFKIIKFKTDELKSKLAHCGIDVSFEFPLVIHGADQVKIGNNVVINSFVHIWGNGGVEIGDNTMIASHVAITSLTHDKLETNYKDSTISKKIIIGKNVWIGTHAILLPGVCIGDNAIIGAGALVNKDVANGEIVGGIPAKPLKYS
jgi:maltose O-acetyltransferase